MRFADQGSKVPPRGAKTGHPGYQSISIHHRMGAAALRLCYQAKNNLLWRVFTILSISLM